GIDAGNPILVLPATGDNAGNHRAVAVKIPRPIIAREEVPTHDVVDVAVFVVVEAIARRFLGIEPNIFPIDVAVVPVKPRIDDSNNYGLGILAHKPPGRIRRGVETDGRQSPLIGKGLTPGALADKILAAWRLELVLRHGARGQRQRRAK